MQSGDVLNGRYEIRRILGEGGMGAVWLAWDQALEKEVAIKTLLPQTLSDLRAAQQLKKEVRLSQELRHDNICATYDLHESRQQPFLVMEYIEGETLSNFIFKQPGHRCSLATFQALAPQILDAAGYAHRKGVVHRDLKSGNIMVTRAGIITLMAFGTAARLKETYSRTTGAPVSLSVHYASPEQINGAKPAPSMDIYSLGCVFYEMLAGEPPFTHGDVLHQQLPRSPDPIPQVPDELNAVLRACLQKDPSARPASAEAIRARLEQTSAPAVEKTVRVERAPQPAIPNEAPKPASPPLPLSRQQASPMLRKVLMGAAAVLLVWIISGVVLSNRPSASQEAIRSEQRNEPVRLPSEPRTEVRAAEVPSPVVANPGQLAPESPPLDRRPAAPLEVHGVRIEFIAIPAGEFLMGCSPGDNECDGDERPPHRVRISKPFEMGKYEVTQAQWEAVMGSNPSRFKGPDRPVEQVSWEDAQQFITRLNARNDGYRYRLPTEAEWEYAARAGSTGKYYDDLNQIAWYRDNSGGQTQPVGRKQPNAWGLHDMLGNVWEWCSDWYGEGYYASSPQADPRGPDSGEFRSLRGGSWDNNPRSLRVSNRGGNSPGDRYNLVGFRLLRERFP